MQDVHPKVVQEQLGHSRVAITLDTYSHVLPTMQRDAADKLDALVGAARAEALRESSAASERTERATIADVPTPEKKDWLQLALM